jgi:hypothetical protein
MKETPAARFHSRFLLERGSAFSGVYGAEVPFGHASIISLSPGGGKTIFAAPKQKRPAGRSFLEKFGRRKAAYLLWITRYSAAQS